MEQAMMQLRNLLHSKPNKKLYYLVSFVQKIRIQIQIQINYPHTVVLHGDAYNTTVPAAEGAGDDGGGGRGRGMFTIWCAVLRNFLEFVWNLIYYLFQRGP